MMAAQPAHPSSNQPSPRSRMGPLHRDLLLTLSLRCVWYLAIDIFRLMAGNMKIEQTLS